MALHTVTCYLLDTGFRLIIEFTECLLLVTTNNYNTLANPHITNNQPPTASATDSRLTNHSRATTFCLHLPEVTLAYFCSFQDNLCILKWGLLFDDRRAIFLSRRHSCTHEWLRWSVSRVNCCWPSSAQSFLVPGPAGLMTIFFSCHDFGSVQLLSSRLTAA
jgi:hypothetical protein